MKQIIFVTLASASLTGCWDFDAAYDSYCGRVGCDGGVAGGASGGSAGGSAGGASGGSAGGASGGTAGGASGGTAGGASGGTAGGASGGTAGGASGGTAGGASGGTAGGASGGTAGGASGGSAGDAGLPPCTQDLCLWRNTQRTDVPIGAGVMGSSLTEAAAIFKVRGASPRAVTLQHQQLGPAATTGIFRALLGMGVAYGDLSAGKGRPDDFFFVTNASLTTAAIQRVQSGGLPGIVYDGTCGVTSIGARSFAIVGDGGVLLVGGNDEGLCEVEVNTNQSRVLQPEVQNGPGNDVTAIYQGADAGLFFTTEDGYVFKAGVGRVSPQLDTSSYGMVAIDGTAGGDIWAIGREGVVARLGDDGGFEPVATLGGPLYGVRVTPEGVYVTAYGALFLRTGTTDGGFSRVPLPTVGSVSRPYHLNAGPGYVHVSGDYGLFSSNGIPAGAFFMTFRTRSP